MPPASLQSQSNMETIRGSIWDKLSCTEWQEAQGRGLLRARECIHLKNAVDCRCMRKHVTIVDSCVHSDVWFRSLLITLAGYLRCLRKPTPADEAWSFLEWCSATDCSLGVSACARLSSWEGGCNFFQPWAPTRSVFTALSWTSEWQLWKQVNLWQFDTQQYITDLGVWVFTHFCLAGNSLRNWRKVSCKPCPKQGKGKMLALPLCPCREAPNKIKSKKEKGKKKL